MVELTDIKHGWLPVVSRSKWGMIIWRQVTSVRLVITIDVTYGWKIYQLDVNNAFLNGIL
jgi:hypothetical protein